MNDYITALLIAIWGAFALHVLLVWGQAWLSGQRARRSISPNSALSDTPFVSILIPAWKERTTLEATLRALQQLSYPKWEAIVIAGGPDGTEAFARQLCQQWLHIRVIAQPPSGKNAAFNLGYREARGEIIVLLDADCIVAPDWLTQLVAVFEQGAMASLANYLPTDRTWVSAQFEMEKISVYEVHEATTLHGGGIAVRRDVIEQLGGFPEDITVGVDWDFDQRVTKLGVKKAFVQDARHTTLLPATLKKYFHDEIRWRRAHLHSTAHFFNGTVAGLLTTVNSLSFYLIGILFFAMPFISILLSSLSPLLIYCWPAFWAWVLLRRIGLVIEVFSYTRDWSWWGRIWTPPALLVVSFLSALIALLTVKKRVIFFQGPRPQ